MKKIISAGLALVLALGLTTGAFAVNVKNFADVKNTDWYADAVAYVVDAQLFSGTSSTAFTPNGTMNRAMFVTVLGRMKGAEAAQTADNGKFEDIDYDSYYGPYVVWASENGIVSGTSNTMFSPNAAITREQAAVIIHRYLTAAGISMPTSSDPAAPFADMASVSSYAKDAVDAMRLSGFIAGSAGSFHPNGNLTRAQAATILMRVKYYIENGKLYEAPKAEPPAATGKASFTLNEYEYNYKTSEYDSDISGITIGRIEITDDMYKDMPLMPGVMPYKVSCSDESIIKVSSAGQLHSPIMLKDGEADKVAYITVTNTEDNTSATIKVTITNRSDAYYTFDDDYITAYGEEVLRLANEARVAEGLSTMTYGYEAQECINARSEELIIHYAHEIINQNLLEDYNVSEWRDGSENILESKEIFVNGNKTRTSPERMAFEKFNSWMTSSGHRFAIMYSGNIEMVVGLAYDEANQTLYSAQWMRAPRVLQSAA